MSTRLAIPRLISRKIDAEFREQLQSEGLPVIDFSQPKGAAALTAPDSISWRIINSPLSVFIGGITAVILEFAEARIRAGVWDHSTFTTDPIMRLRRTGLAAMVTVYAPAKVAEDMIAGVNRAHSRVSGIADDGRPYIATDPDLLNWVQATATFSFAEAYHQFVHPLSEADRNRAYAESLPAARLYGAMNSPGSTEEWETFLADILPSLTPSPIVHEFLDIMRSAPALPGLARQTLQPLLVRAAISLVPLPVQIRLGLSDQGRLSASQKRLVKILARAASRLHLPSSPASQACIRMGLPADYLIRS